MAARKLQTEIDRTLKKVSEGVELFESIYDKMQSSTNQTQKEKLETDLKTQIKKLQRLRDQIKTWVASNDIKDKSQLMDNRKLIETQMERFKACEKEMKTKAFSKEGLIASQKMDPKEREKLEVSDWISTTIAELERQVEQTEAELVTLLATGKKKKSSNGRSEELQHLIDRRKWHMGRLELVLRLVNNGTIAPEEVNSIKEDVNYFVESNVEEDFEENEFIYDELNLDEQEEAFRMISEEAGHSDDDVSNISDPPPPPRPSAKEKKQPSHDDTPISPVLKKQVPPPRRATVTEKPELPKPPVPTANFATQPMSSALKAGLPQQTTSSVPVKPVLMPMRYAAAAGGNTTSTSTSTTQPPPPPSSIPPPTPASANASVPAPSQSSAPPSPSAVSMSVSVSSPVPSSAVPTSHVVGDGHSMNGSYYQDDSRGPSPVVSPAEAANGVIPKEQSTASVVDPTMTIPRAAPPPPGIIPISVVRSGPGSEIHPQPIAATTAVAAPLPQLNPSPIPQQVQIQQQQQQQQQSQQQEGAQGVPYASADGLAQAPGTQQRPIGAGQIRGSQQQPQQQRVVPGSLGDLVSSFDAVKQKATQRMANPDQVHKILDVAMGSLPQPADAEKPNHYSPKNPYNTPPYYPQDPSQILSSPQLISRLDVETLFYIFYYLPGTYQQYLAAQQLKGASWRFHVKYLTWFQRHSEPQAITEDYEQGVYVYFDWEGSWCQRKKTDFRFEYRYLSDD